jgi:hypothetical protein
MQRNLHSLKIILLLDKYKDGQIVWNVAVAGSHVGVLGRLWSSAKREPIKRENLNYNFFLDEHRVGIFTFHVAYIEVPQNVLGLTEAAQIPGDDLRGAIFLDL